jgi:hypothetical protein
VAGYALLLLVYGVLWLPPLGLWEVLGCLFLFGAYYAATDGVLMALASAALPGHLRGSGLALLTTVVALSRLCASVLFGALWTVWGVQAALALFGLGLVAALVLAVVVLARAGGVVGHEQPATA